MQCVREAGGRSGAAGIACALEERAGRTVVAAAGGGSREVHGEVGGGL